MRRVRDMDDDELAQANSEMRYITLELMKIAARKRAPFSDVMSEFIQNVYSLTREIRHRTVKQARRARRRMRSGSGIQK